MEQFVYFWSSIQNVKLIIFITQTELSLIVMIIVYI